MNFKNPINQFSNFSELLQYVAKNNLSKIYDINEEKLRDIYYSPNIQRKEYIKYKTKAQDIDSFLTLLLKDKHPFASSLQRKRKIDIIKSPEILDRDKVVSIIQLNEKISSKTVIQLAMPVVLP